MYVKIVFTLNYEEGHPLYIDAMALFHVTLRKRKLRRYMIDRAKRELLYLIDYLFNPEVTNMLEFKGVEKIPDRQAKKEKITAPEYPEVYFLIIWWHRDNGLKQMYQEIRRVE